MTARTARANLASSLVTSFASAYEDIGTGWAIYSSAPDVLSVPAVVISPRSPYRNRLTQTLDEISLMATILVNRAGGPRAMDVMDNAIDVLLPALLEAGAKVDETTSISITQDVGGVEYLTATTDLELTV
jgi:hypothetical protein